MADLSCHFCRRPAWLPDAIDDGWLPYFYRGEQEVDEPVCRDCACRHLIRGADGEWEEAPPADPPTAVIARQ